MLTRHGSKGLSSSSFSDGQSILLPDSSLQITICPIEPSLITEILTRVLGPNPYVTIMIKIIKSDIIFRI